jgi:hypothetical protein
MKRTYKTVPVLFIILIIASVGFAGYNREAVVATMQANAQNMGAIKAAMENQDYFATAEALMAVAVATKPMLEQDPPKGSKAEWDRIHSEIIEAAFRGIGACADENMDAVGAQVGKIGSLIGEGHNLFRK